MINKLVIFIFCCGLLFTNCRKNNYDTIPSDIGKSYWPIKLGNQYIYKADSIKYGYTGIKASGDTISFFIKEIISQKIIDSLGTTYILARYHSKDTLNWTFVKNYFLMDEKFRINNNENNIITTQMLFPVSLHYYWNGNDLNLLDPKEYEYTALNFDFNYFTKAYKNCLKVKIDSTDNLRERKIESKFYSKNIGLIYYESINLLLLNNDSLDKFGNLVLQRPPKIEKGTIFKKGLLNLRE